MVGGATLPAAETSMVDCYLVLDAVWLANRLPATACASQLLPPSRQQWRGPSCRAGCCPLCRCADQLVVLLGAACSCCCCLQLQSVQLPFALIPVLAFNASETLMGPKFVNSKATIACTVAISLVVMVVNVSGVLAFFEAALSGASSYAWAALAVGVVAYLLFVGYLFLHATAAAGLLPAGVGFVAPQPGGESRDSMGGGAFVAVPFDSDDSEGSQGGQDEECGPEVIRAFPSPSSRDTAAVAATSEDEEAQCLPGSYGASSSGSGSCNNRAWIAHSQEEAPPSGAAGGAGDEEQQLTQPLLPHRGLQSRS